MFLSKRYMDNNGSAKDILFWFTFFTCILLGSFICVAGCRKEENMVIPYVQELQFVNPKIEMSVGERQAMKLNMLPVEARKYYTVSYTASAEGYVTISETSTDGCVLTAEKGGAVVVVAKAGGYTAYLEVIIDNDDFFQNPYIMIPTQVVELSEGSRKTVQVSLFNGSAVDQQQFKWAVELGKDNISISPTGNTVVVQGEKRGSQKIIVSHEKSEFTAEILIFVLGSEERVKYITTGENVILMNAGGENKQFSATLVNGAATDISGFTFNIVEEDPCITILSSNNTCNVLANRKGTAVIRIEHPLAEYPLDVRVIVMEGEESYIDLDKTFMILDINQGGFINAGLGGTYKQNWNGDFSYELRGDTGCITVNQTNFSFYITAIKSGRCIIEVKNKNIAYSREALIVVRDAAMVPPDEYYITTSQNVIQLEIGQTLATQLNIQLINGNDGDKASFEWTVEDGRVVAVEALDLPLGKGVNYLTRAQAEIKMVANTLALVTPKSVGTTRIVVSHPKSPSVAAVICKVYPRGTFANVPFILENPEGGLIKVDTTKVNSAGLSIGEKKVTLKMASGDEHSLGSLQWTTGNQSFASVIDENHSLENVIKGISTGVTKLEVSNTNLKNPYEATVMVGTTEELKNMSVLYVDQVYQTVAVGQNISVTVKNSNGDNNALANSDQYTISGYDKTKVVATMIKNRLLLQGLAEGSTSVTVGNTSGAGITATTVNVSIVSGDMTISQPYTLTGPDFVGMNYGQEKMVMVGLTDATVVEKGKIQWKSDNAAIVKVTGNGENGMLTAGSSTSQTNITVSHSKSVNDKVMVVYVVPPGVDQESVVVLGIEQDHWLLKPDEEIMLQLLTNADETAARNINDIVWGGYDISVLEVDYNGSRALVRAKGTGSTVITVTHPKKLIDLKIYVSVSDMASLDKNITLPSIVELIIGENKVITAVTQGLSEAGIKGITWSIDDSSVAGISGEGTGLTGGKLFIQGKERGQAWITAKQDSFGYQKKILLVCARTYEELMNTFVLASEESYYRMKVGDSRDIRLVCGSAGFPETEKPFITWKDEGNKVVKIYADGDHAKIEAAAPGISTVTVNHSLILKPVSVTFEAYTESLNGSDYKFNSNALMIGLVVRKSSDPADANNTKNLIVSVLPVGPSYAGIEAYDEEPDKKIFTFMQSSNEFILTGAAKGQTYLHIKHKQVAEDLRILVYAADTLAELNEMFPIGLSKPNYLLTIGDVSQYITITVPQQDILGLTDSAYKAKLDRIVWGLDNTRVVDYVISTSASDLSTYRQHVKIDGRNVGNCVFDIKYDNQVVEKAYVSVKSKTALDMSKRIVTENIIGMKPGDTMRKTSIGSNLTPDEIATLEWRTGNAAIVSVSPVSGDKGSIYLTAVSAGETEVVVSFGQIERYIKVYVNANPGQYKAVNLDNRYYMLRKNDEMTLSAFHAALSCTSADNWVFYPKADPFDTRVVELINDGKDKVRIKGLNEGIATVVLYNTECLTDVSFMVEVNNTAPLVEDFIEDWYMTAFKTVYALDPSKTMDWTRVTVSGIRFPPEQLTQIKWRVKSETVNGVQKELKENENSTLIDLANKNGTFVDIAPKNKNGTAVLTASHEKSVNKELDITVMCDAELVAANPVAHIVVDKEVVKVKKGETSEVTITIEDFKGLYDIGKFNAFSDAADKVTAHITGNKLTVKGVDWGQALVTITHPDVTAMQKKIVVMVNMGNDLVYLTTQQNFVVLEKNNYQAVNVELVGMTDYNNSNYIWDTDDWNIISINASGKSAVVTAKTVTQTARITVKHVSCPEYPLFIYVRVTDKISSNPTYITTSNNIVAIKEGASMQIKANLVNGGGHELSQFQWSTGDRHLIELNYSGDTAMIKGLKPGTAGVAIWHPSSLNSITILIVVEPNEPNNGIYITTDSLLVEVATTASQQLVKARLVGGNAEDIYGFQWSVTRYNSVLRKNDGTGYQVVDMNANADMCYLYPRKEAGVPIEGEAILTVSHPKTNYKLDIKIVVSDQTPITFAQAYLTMNQYSQQTVSVNASANSRLSYTSTNSNVASVEGTDKLCVIDAKSEGMVIIIVSNMNGTKSSELVVRVNKVDLNDYFYLRLSTNIITMQTTDAARVAAAEIIDTKTGKVNDELTNGIKWKIKESDRAKGVVKLDGFSDSSVIRMGGTVTLYPAASGDIEVICGFFDTNDPLLKRYPALADNCAGKSIYVKVQVSDFQFVLSHAVINMTQGETVTDVWARVDNVQPVPNYKIDGDILWASEKPEIAAVMYQNDSNNRSNVSLYAMNSGSAQIYANYGASRQVISVVVAANAYVSSTKSNVPLMPDITDTFIITSNPPDKSVTVTIDSNAACTVEARPYMGAGNNASWQTMPSAFITQNGAQKTAGYEGYEFRLTGSLYESVATMTFEMRDTGKKTQVFINNFKNYYVKWRDKAQIRFQPDTPETITINGVPNQPNPALRVYYDISPPTDKLIWENDNGGGSPLYFRVVPGEDANGNKFIDFRKITGASYFKPTGIEKQYFYTQKDRNSVTLGVYIYYDNVNVTWKHAGTEFIENSSSTIYKDYRSEYDSVNYAVQVANREKFYLQLNAKDSAEVVIGNGEWVDQNSITGKNVTANRDNNTYNSIYFQNGNDSTTNIVQTVTTGVDYIGVYQVSYRYFNGYTTPTEFHRNFLVYGKNVSRKIN